MKPLGLHGPPHAGCHAGAHNTRIGQGIRWHMSSLLIFNRYMYVRGEIVAMCVNLGNVSGGDQTNIREIDTNGHHAKSKKTGGSG